MRRSFFLLALGLVSCHRSCAANDASGDASNDAAIAVASDASPVVAARCTSIDHKATLGVPVAVGDAIATERGFAVGVLREKNIFSVALASPDLSKVTFVDIGPAKGEAAPPQPFLWEKSVYVAWINSGDLRLGRVDDSAVVVAAEQLIDAVSVSSAIAPTSDIPALDVLTSGDHGLAIWDFADPSRGTIRALEFSKSGIVHPDGGTPIVDISPASSDADTPRLAPRAGGAWAIWIARKAEPASDASAIEGAGETPTYRWLEAAPLDDRGARVGEVVRLTPTNGHVAGYDVFATPDGAQVVFRDAAEAVDEGTTLFRITLRDEPSPIETIAPSGIGRAVPDIVGAGALAWVVTPDVSDATRLIPLVPATSPNGGVLATSIEPFLRSARALTLRSGDHGFEMLTLRPGTSDEAEIALVSCGH